MEKIEVYKLTKEWVEQKYGQPVEKSKSICFLKEIDAHKAKLEIQGDKELLATKKNPCMFIDKVELSKDYLNNMKKAGKFFETFDSFVEYCFKNAKDLNANIEENIECYF